jgi:hypothetical protein
MKKLVGSWVHQHEAVFVVGPEDETPLRIPVHPFLLKLVSEPFTSMFSGNWMQESDIRISDCDASAMYSVIRWIYCGELVVRKGKFPGVLYIANKYLITPLLDFINGNHDEFIESEPWKMLTFATESGNEILTDKTAKRIADDLERLISDNKFYFASGEGIAAVLSKSCFIPEMVLFERCLDWAENECHKQGLDPFPANRRLVMQPFFHMIAFPGMTMEEFAGRPISTGLLCPEEESLIFQHIVARTSTNNTASPSTSRIRDSGFRSQARTRRPCPYWRRNDRSRFYECNQCRKRRCYLCFQKFRREACHPLITDGNSERVTRNIRPIGVMSMDDCAGCVEAEEQLRNMPDVPDEEGME